MRVKKKKIQATAIARRIWTQVCSHRSPVHWPFGNFVVCLHTAVRKWLHHSVLYREIYPSYIMCMHPAHSPCNECTRATCIHTAERERFVLRTQHTFYGPCTESMESGISSRWIDYVAPQTQTQYIAPRQTHKRTCSEAIIYSYMVWHVLRK